MISAVSVTGGHLGAGLGVVELTVAVHYVFDTPQRQIDLGRRPPGLSAQDRHRAARPHPHASAGRRAQRLHPAQRERVRPVRGGAQLDLISAALGFAIANKLSGEPGRAIAVIGDGALSAGMAYEAMNNAEAAGNRLIVILNDNDMSIAPPVGALRNSLWRGWCASNKYLAPRRLAQKLARAMPERAPSRPPARSRNIRAAAVTGGTLFEELGFYYVGPVDGHDVRGAGRGARERPRRRRRADAGPRRHPQGQGLRAGRERRPTNITGWSSSTSSRASRPSRPRRRAAELYERVCQGARGGDGARREGRRRSPRRCLRAPGSTRSPTSSPTACSTSASPSSMR